MMMAPDNLIFSAVDALMYPSYALGAPGSIAAILERRGHVRTVGRRQGGRPPGALDLHQRC